MRANQEALFLAVVVLGLILAVLVILRTNDDARNRCVQTGGTIAEVQGGSGGWICLRPAAL